MKIVATWKTAKWYYVSSMCGINTFRREAIPDGFETITDNFNNFEELQDYVKGRTIVVDHKPTSRALQLSDLDVKVYP